METDDLLAIHLEKCPRNASMISKTVQNDLLLHMRNFIIQHFGKAIANSSFLSVLADAISDVSNKEQLEIGFVHLSAILYFVFRILYFVFLTCISCFVFYNS